MGIIVSIFTFILGIVMTINAALGIMVYKDDIYKEVIDNNKSIRQFMYEHDTKNYKLRYTDWKKYEKEEETK